MNEFPGIIGTKIGMTQLFQEDGTMVACTVIQAGCRVIGKRTEEVDGYSALILGLGERKDKHTTQAHRGEFVEKKDKDKPQHRHVGPTPRHIQELRAPADYVAGFELGQDLKVEEIFKDGQFVDVQAVSKGRGFTGVMRRYNFKGAKASHGAHETHRHGGSIGTTTTPGRVLPGKKMAGQHGNKTVSVLNQRVAKVIPETQLVLIRGTVPGAKSSIVRVRGAVKKNGGEGRLLKK